MRGTLRIFLTGLCLVLPAACDAPAAEAPVGAAMAATPVAQPLTPGLPDAVAATVARLQDIAANGDVRDMAELAEQTPAFRSNAAGMSHRNYWNLKLRTGDWPMAHAEKLLSYPYAVAETARGRIFIWPRLATLHGEDITPAVAREIDALLGAGRADEILKGAHWPGYVLGIAEDGTWLYFVSGEG